MTYLTLKFLERSNEIEIFDENKDYDFDLIIFVDLPQEIEQE